MDKSFTAYTQVGHDIWKRQPTAVNLSTRKIIGPKSPELEYTTEIV